jgi:hypothetical protein
MNWTDALITRTENMTSESERAKSSLYPYFKQEWVACIPQDLPSTPLTAAPLQKSIRELFLRSEKSR